MEGKSFDAPWHFFWWVTLVANGQRGAYLQLFQWSTGLSKLKAILIAPALTNYTSSLSARGRFTRPHRTLVKISVAQVRTFKNPSCILCAQNWSLAEIAWFLLGWDIWSLDGIPMIFHDVSSFHGEAGGRPQVVPALMEVFGIPLALAAVQAGRRAATAHLADVLWRSPTFSNKSLEILGYFWSMVRYGHQLHIWESTGPPTFVSNRAVYEHLSCLSFLLSLVLWAPPGIADWHRNWYLDSCNLSQLVN